MQESLHESAKKSQLKEANNSLTECRMPESYDDLHDGVTHNKRFYVATQRYTDSDGAREA